MTQEQTASGLLAEIKRREADLSTLRAAHALLVSKAGSQVFAPTGVVGETWREAIDRLLPSAPDKMPVRAIVAALKKEGRTVNGRTSMASIVRSTIHHSKDKMGWEGDGTGNWWKKKGGSA